MYKNYPEHPEIAEILQNGETNEMKIARKRDMKFFEIQPDLQVCESICISKKEFIDICCKRNRE